MLFHIMAPIRYSLHYEDYSEHIMSRFGKLLQMQSLVDMTLMCSSHTLRVHKAVLAASSAYFQEVLQKQTGEPLIILKMRFSVLKCLVEFMYCGKTQCLEENLDELVSAAQFLKIKGLSKVTKEGLGITDHSEVPPFTPPVVISRPPQSLLDLHAQEEPKCQPQAPFPPPTNSFPPPANPNTQVDVVSRKNKDMVVRIPFDIENGGSTPTASEYMDGPRVIKPRRGRPSLRQRVGAWDPAGLLGRTAERTLLRREQDSRKAIHQLKHLQTKQMQDYMDRVSLTEAVSSICGPDNSNSHSYMNIDNDLMYIGPRPSNVIDPSVSYNKEHSFGSVTTSSYAHAPISSSTTAVAPNNSHVGTAMSQYVNALKNAGLPTDLPILFESGDGSYINVNEQVLLDMVQSSEIQYEVIEQPNIIEKVADPTEIKSIDDLSKSIERGEMLLGHNSASTPYTPFTSYKKDSTEYSQQDETINGLNSILPDNLEPFSEQQNFSVMDGSLQERNSALDPDSTHNFSCMDSDMQFFTKSMSDDVKKYYDENQLNDDARELEQLCPASTSLDTNFSMSLLDTKTSHTGVHQYSSLSTEDDFGLQLPHNLDFKEDPLNCFMSTPKHNNDDTNLLSDKENQDRAEIIKDLMNIADTIDMTQTEGTNEKSSTERGASKSQLQNYIENAMDSFHMRNDDAMENSTELRESISSDADWNIGNSESKNVDTSNNSTNESENPYHPSIVDLTDTLKDTGDWKINEDEMANKENCTANHSSISPPSSLEHDIPFAVGLLPLNKETVIDDENILKRKQSMNDDVLDSGDAKCLKRKIKYKKK